MTQVKAPAPVPQEEVKSQVPSAMSKIGQGLKVFIVARNKQDADKYGHLFSAYGVNVFFSSTFSCVADAVIVVAERPGDLQELAGEFTDFTRAPVVALIGQNSHSKGFS